MIAVIILLSLLLICAITLILIILREINRLTDKIKDLNNETNRRVTIGIQLAPLCDLANAVNRLSDNAAEEKIRYMTESAKMQESMTNISHDLRTPLTSISGYIKILQEGGNTPEQEKKYLDVIERKSRTLQSLTNDLFALTRLESSAYHFTCERLDANELLKSALAEFYGDLTAKGEQPEISIYEHPLMITADSAAAKRVFDNLLSNMVRHAQSKMEISSALVNKTAVFRFQNYAPSLGEEEASRLFERFFIADRMRSGENTGLGLAITKELTEQMGGKITTEYKNGQLSFELTFDLCG